MNYFSMKLRKNLKFSAFEIKFNNFSENDINKIWKF